MSVAVGSWHTLRMDLFSLCYSQHMSWSNLNFVLFGARERESDQRPQLDHQLPNLPKVFLARQQYTGAMYVCRAGRSAKLYTHALNLKSSEFKRVSEHTYTHAWCVYYTCVFGGRKEGRRHNFAISVDPVRNEPRRSTTLQTFGALIDKGPSAGYFFQASFKH